MMMKYSKMTTGAGVSRREALLMLGASILAGPALARPATRPACIVTPQQTEGPYFSDLKLNRSDIRADPADRSVKPGAPLALTLRVHKIAGERCVPLPDAIVDIWHCDAEGAYSDAKDSTADTRGRQFLRGYQVTDADGMVRFNTIYPGAYPGRAVHVHFKVRTRPERGPATEFTSQLYFPDSVTERVHAKPPYARLGRAHAKNRADGLFRQGGQSLMLDIETQAEGYAGSFDIGLVLG
jgi:protocatechuate 3,4-dioxygenase beta subunit